MIRRWFFSFIALILLPGFLVAQTPPIPERRVVVFENTDLFGSDIRSIFDTTQEICTNACLADATCTALTFNQTKSACFLKSGFGESSPFDGAISMRVLDTPDDLVQLATLRAAELDFLPGSYLRLALTRAAGLGRAYPVNGDGLNLLLALGAGAQDSGDLLQAVKYYATALNYQDDSEAWFDLARLAHLVQSDERAVMRNMKRLRRDATVNAYLRARTPIEQAEILFDLAQILEQGREGRKSIDALRLAQQLSPNAGTQAALVRAIGLYGFRIMDHQVDNNAQRPRICLNFSEPLVEVGVDYASYISVDAGDLPVVAEGEQLCIEGVEHGKTYGLFIRSGLPAASGETLFTSVNMSVYVRDRDPSVRFLGRAYVLPAGESAAIPVVSVNTDEVELRIHRVGARNLLTLIENGVLGASLDSYGEGDIARRYGAPVWSGIGEVGRELNLDVTTALPIGEAVQRFEPGVYVMTARVVNSDDNDWESAATQWFIVTDLGVETLLGADGLHVFVRSLSDAQPRAGITTRLLAVNNEVLAEVQTNAQGYARFPVGYTQGTGGMAPAMVQVEGENDFAFLDLQEAGFDLSDRGVDGRNAPLPIDIFASTERGAYRPGETVFATILARDSGADALSGLPLTVIVSRPDGVEHARELLPDAGAGGRAYRLTLPQSAMRGTWTLRIHADPDDTSLRSLRFLVEDFTPDRIDFDINLPDQPVDPQLAPMVSVEARYLYGAPAAGLAVKGDVTLNRSRTSDQFPGVLFGLADEPFIQGYQQLDSEVITDARGTAVFAVPLPVMEPTTQLLDMQLTLRMADASTRPVERRINRPLLPDGPRIGIKPLFDGALQEAELARFEVIAIGPDMVRRDLDGASWTLSRIQHSYQWYRVDGRWNWEPITRRTRIASGDMDLSRETPALIEVPVEWGSYELKIASTSGGGYVAASYGFSAGWWSANSGSDTPDLLELGLDRDSYAIGDTAHLRLNPRYAGVALVRVVSDHLISMQAVDVTANETTLDLPVTADWGVGAYVTATLIRPMDVAAGRNPMRALGLGYAPVDPGTRALNAAFDMPPEVAPRGPMDVVLRVDAPNGEPVFATIAAVDLGILNLTGFESPDPQGHYFGQRKLGMEFRDLYGRLIDGMQGSPGLLRSGGDGGMVRAKSPEKEQELLAYFSGPLQVGPDGTVRTSFDLPAFNGTVRLMAVVWSDNGVGQAEQDVLVRDDIVVATSLPRFMAPGDSSRILLELTHVKGPARVLDLDIQTSGDIFIPLADTRQPVNLEVGGTRQISLPIRAGAAGSGTITLTINDPVNGPLVQTETVSIRANDPAVLRSTTLSLPANGGAFSLGRDAFNDLVAGSGTATLTLGPLARFNAPALLDELDRYPYGCTEQLAATAMPLLYFADIAKAMDLGDRDATTQRVNDAITAILAHQASGGSFGLWRPDSGDLWLDSFATDFLGRARSQGFDVPAQAYARALENLRNRLNYAGDFENAGQDIAYALMVLAREGQASIGDLRYYADTKAADFATPLALAQLGAALAYYGDQPRADALFARAYGMVGPGVEDDQAFRDDYGSKLRDMAGLLALAVEVGSNAVDQDALARRVAGVAPRYRSTQESLWTLLAAHALAEQGQSAGITINGAPITGPLVRRISDADLSGPPLVITNTGAQPVKAVLAISGVPSSEQPAQSDGYRIERWLYTLDGDPANLDALQQNDRLVAILRITPEQDRKGRLMVSDPLPAGLEIDNPHLLRSGDLAAIDWLTLDNVAVHTEFRDDRFLAAVDWDGTHSFQLAYIVRAISPGVFHRPAASVVDMYRPEIRARTAGGMITVQGN